MPRKTSPLKDTGGTTIAPEPSSAGLPVDLRPGAAISPETVNVFEEGVSAGAAAGLRLAPLHGRPASDAIALSVRAWVRNLSYIKDVWIDLALAGAGGELVHAETLPLSFLEPAEGDGDFFTVGTAVPAPGRGSAAPTLLYRLYGQMHGQVFTDGILHRHEIAAAPAVVPPAKTAPAAPAPAVPVKAPPAAKAPKATAPKATAPKATAPKATAAKAAPKAALTPPAPVLDVVPAKTATKAAVKPKAPATAKTVPAEKTAATGKAPAAPRKRATPKA
jgi:hypothetical protein